MGFRFTGSLAGNYVGYFVDRYNPVNVFRIGLIFSVSIILPLMLGYMPEKYIENPVLETKKLKQKKATYILALVMAISTIGLSIVSSFKNLYALFAAVILIPSGLYLVLSSVIEKQTARICCFVFLTNALVVDYFSIRNDWLLSNKKCFDNTPNFSQTFLFTTSQFVGNIFGLLATLIFQRLLKSFYIMHIFFLSVLIRLVGCVFEVLMVVRINLSLGIPDHLLFIMSNEIFWNMARAFSNIGIVMLMSLKKGDNMHVPFIATFESMGYAFASALGVILTEFFGIRICNFEKYWLLTLIGSCALPATLLFFAYYLIPMTKVTEEDSKESSSGKGDEEEQNEK